MNTAKTTNRRVRWLAGVVASIANVLLLTAVIGLADHYARTAADARMEAGSLAQQAVTAASRNS